MKKNFRTLIKCWTYDNAYVDEDVIVRDYCYITADYRGCAHTDCNIHVKLNHKDPIVFHNLKNYDSHLIVKKLEKFKFEIDIEPYGLEICMSFSINKKLSFIDSVQLLGSSLDSLIKNLRKDDFRYLS